MEQHPTSEADISGPQEKLEDQPHAKQKTLMKSSVMLRWLCRRNRRPAKPVAMICSFAHTRISIVGWIYDPDHSLPPGMYVDVPHLDCLLVAALITVEGLDHLILKPQQLDGVVAVNVDEVLGHVAMALSKKS
jgi:hypothetical protein